MIDHRNQGRHHRARSRHLGLSLRLREGTHEDKMKPEPAPNVPGKTEFEKFDNFFRAVIAVPKAVIDKEDAKWRRARAKKKRAKKPA